MKMCRYQTHKHAGNRLEASDLTEIREIDRKRQSMAARESKQAKERESVRARKCYLAMIQKLKR